MRSLIFIFLIIAGFASCGNSDSSDILSMGEMEDVLYDMHLSQNMSEQGSFKERELKIISNHEAILRKYEITQAEWDSSYNYYCRHTDKLHKIYEDLADRVRNEIVDLGGDVSLDEAGMAGDTANIWHGERNFILMQQSPYNIHSFEIKADSTIKVGDMITLNFDDKFIFQEGSRELIVALAVTLNNDSIVSSVRHVGSDGHESVSFRDNGHIGVKSIKGYFLLKHNINDQYNSAFHLVSIENVRMVLAHEKEDKDTPDSNNTKPANAKDSLSDSVTAPGRNHMLRPEDRQGMRPVTQ